MDMGTKQEAIELYRGMLQSKKVKKEVSSVYDRSRDYGSQYIYPCYLTLVIEGEKVFKMEITDSWTRDRYSIFWNNYHGWNGGYEITKDEYETLKAETNKMEQIDRYGAIYKGLEGKDEILKLL